MKRPPRPATTRIDSPAAPESGRWPMTAVFGLILVLVLVAYFPALKGGFLWDDAGHVTHPELRSWSGLLRIWFEPGVTQQYYPLLHSAFWLEHRLWGDATVGYHLVNLLWHATSACLLVAILRRLAVPGALLAGLLFALHPVCVESVAWISEQKNTLSTVLYLAAALVYLGRNDSMADTKAAMNRRFSLPRSAVRYACATALFLLALLTKTVTATLPAALLVVAWWRRGRLSWRGDALPLLPWLVAGAAMGLFTVWFERTGIGAQGADFDLSVVERGLLAGRAFWFYLGKLVWPAELAFFYPRWTIDDGAVWQYLFPIAALALLGGLVWWAWRRRGRGPLTAFLLFGGTLFPVLGVVNVYPFVFSYVADHFQYLAALPILALVASTVAGGREWSARLSQDDALGRSCRREEAETTVRAKNLPRYLGSYAAGAVVVVALGVLTWRQCHDYVDSITLYRATLARNPDSWIAHHNLGTTLDEAGRTDESLPHLQRANELKPDSPETLNSLGNVLNRLGRAAEARPLLERAIQLQPRFDSAHNTLGVSLMALGQSDAGMASFTRALEINPRLTIARVNLGWALANTGRHAEALAQLEQARREQPDNADAEFKTGLVCAMTGRISDAARHVRRAVDLQPDNPEMRHVLGAVLLELGRPADAAEQFEEALRLAPGHRDAREGLEQARRQLQR